MSKFYGAVGYDKQIETSPGVWISDVSERSYAGDIIKNNRRWQDSGGVNDNLVLSTTISIIGDEYSYNNLSAIKYIKWMGGYWEVTNVEIPSPRILLTIGGVYNGEKAPIAI